MASPKGSLLMNIENAVQLTWTNATGATVSVGDVIALSTKSGKRMAAVVLNNEDHQSGTIANGETGQVLVRGRVKVKKVATVQTFSQGSTVWWDYSVGNADDSTTCGQKEDFVVGMCTEAAAATATHVEVDLNEGPNAFSIGSSSSSTSV